MRLTWTVELNGPVQVPKLQSTLVEGAVESGLTLNWVGTDVPPVFDAVTATVVAVEAPDVQL
jgi:hypothetical protein